MQWSWMSPKVQIEKAGPKGEGVFVVKEIFKDDVVAVAGGRIVSLETLDNDPNFSKVQLHAFQVENDLCICPPGLDPERASGIFKVNHSCDPTCGIRGQITIVALRYIGPGEEVTFDYAMTDTCELRMKCHCGSLLNCRKIITGEDWKRKDLQKKYEGHFSSYIEKLIREQNRLTI